MRVFDKELFSSPNIIVHGFVSVNSKAFEEILSSCVFVIFPSCSEGGSPSVLTAVGNGALIPIISHESSVSTGNEIFIDSFDFSGIEKAVLQAELYSEYEIHELMTENLKVVMENNSQDAYYSNLKKIISRIINHEM
ncbi:glycosyltransferase [Marinomonas polaris]|uniref:glycosyltransferase n=1 Tax=Marinomonas polaris TaxID=293552 RepID=UPI00351449BC